MKPLVTPIKPPDFTPTVEVAACYILVDTQVLLLQYGQDKALNGLWGVPAGKLEAGEKPLQGAHRELYEETGLQTETFTSLGPLYFRKPEIDYVFHLFTVTHNNTPAIRLSTEHCAYQWTELEHVHKLPLVPGALDALTYCQRRADGLE